MEAFVPMYMGFLLVLMRTGALCMVAPLYGTRAVPVRVRVGVSVALAFAAFSAAGMPAFADWEIGSRLVVAALFETIVGLAAGTAARFSLDAMHAAGHAIGVTMGLGFGAVLDPVNGAESTALQQLLTLVALGIAVGAGIHRDAVAWLCRSLIEMPPGTDMEIGRMAAEVVAEGARAAALAIRVAFPVLSAVTLGHMAFGLMTRAAPQMNLSNVGFSVAILAGGGALYIIAPMAAELAANSARAAFTSR